MRYVLEPQVNSRIRRENDLALEKEVSTPCFMLSILSKVQEIPLKNRLRVLRAERSWSQGKLAEELNVSRQTINAIENGKYDPSLPLAFKMSRLFKMSIEDIFEPQEDDLD